MKFYDTVTKHRFTTENRVDAEQVSADLAADEIATGSEERR